MEEEQQYENKLDEHFRLHKKQGSEDLVNLTKRIMSDLQGGLQTPQKKCSVDGVATGLDEIRVISKAWDRMVKKKKNKVDEDLWSRLLNACHRAEVEALREKGYTEKVTAKLVRLDHAWWDQASCQFQTGSAPHEFLRSVQVVVVQREAGFRIHDKILSHLWKHPLFFEDLSRDAVPRPSDRFRETIESVDEIARDYNYDDWNYFPSLDELEGPDRCAVDCIYSGHEMTSLLESRYSGGGNFLGEEEPVESEDLAWLATAKKGERLWQLLNAAVHLGRSLNHYSTFRDTVIEQAIRRFHSAYRGKETTDAGKAIESIISAAKESGLTKITAMNLLEWLQGNKDPISDAKPLSVNHPLWGVELKEISWEKFENLVKSANRRRSPPEAEQD